MADILLATINARYRHCAFGLRWLLANMGDLGPRTALVEFDLEKTPVEMAEALLAHRPRIVGLGVYVWNVEPTRHLVRLLKGLAPEVTLVLGGPEVSHDWEEQEIVHLADHLVTGEGEEAFPWLCRAILAGAPPPDRILHPPPPVLAELVQPYDLYDAEDIAHRILYLEASRGCPFQCGFCLSALDRRVRTLPLAAFLEQVENLLARGALRFKFVDRTFNLHTATACAILDFFLARLRPGLDLHFEVIPDRFPAALRERVAAFPPGVLQLEVGVQSFNPEVLAHIGRRQDPQLSEQNLRWLRGQTGAHLHADLIVGLPGEDWDSIAAGFDRLAALEPHEIQVGILKRLPGAPINRLIEPFGLVFDPVPPRAVLRSDRLDFMQMRRLARFARYWDLIGNSGRFPAIRRMILGRDSGFRRCMALSDWLFARTGRTHRIALARLQDLVAEGLISVLGEDPEEVRACSAADRNQGGGESRQARHRTAGC
ncbi:MAG: cobalamin-dependent protein [Magnetococcales bacterium]|nr:cobalamin-dependent protein [Magnetococcales bacterium]